MGTILVFETADFSSSKIRQVELAPYTWSNLTISTWTPGFVNSNGSTSNNSNWTPVWKFSNKITIPNGVRKLKGVTNAIDVSFNSGQTYTWYPFVLFYNSSSTVPIKTYSRRAIYETTGSVETSAGSNRVQGTKGKMQITIPSDAYSMQFQYVYGSNPSQTGDLSNIVISAPEIQQGVQAS